MNPIHLFNYLPTYPTTYPPICLSLIYVKFQALTSISFTQISEKYSVFPEVFLSKLHFLALKFWVNPFMHYIENFPNKFQILRY